MDVTDTSITDLPPQLEVWLKKICAAGLEDLPALVKREPEMPARPYSLDNITDLAARHEPVSSEVELRRALEPYRDRAEGECLLLVSPGGRVLQMILQAGRVQLEFHAPNMQRIYTCKAPRPRPPVTFTFATGGTEGELETVDYLDFDEAAAIALEFLARDTRPRKCKWAES